MGLYYLQSRYYDSNTGRFINADGYVSTGQGILGNNMYAYCGNNPATRVDHGGELWKVIVLVAIAAGLLAGLTSSEKQEPTQEEIQQAYDFADTIEPKYVGKINSYIYIFSAEELKNSVSPLAREHFYQRLYDNSVAKAKEEGRTDANLMSVYHIGWETRWHLFAHFLGISNADPIELDVEETRRKMIGRGIKSFFV